MTAIYPWAVEQGGPAAWWLHGPFFVARTAVYFAVWLSLAYLWLARGRLGERNAAVGLVLLAASVNFAAIDWTMSLDPGFASSVYGYVAIAATLLEAAALLLLTLARRSTAAPTLASFALALTLIWAYLAFVQYLIVWESDLPREAAWYLRREAGIWAPLFLAAGALHLVPFVMLLWRRVRAGGGLAAAAALLVLGRLLDCWWTVVPGVAGARLSWQAPVAAVALGACTLAVFRHRCRRVPPALAAGAADG
jgi:hypothetical protein